MSNQRKITKTEIYIDGDLDEGGYQVLEVQVSAGGSRLDTVTIGRVLNNHQDEPLQDLHIRENMGSEIEILARSPDGKKTKVLFWGAVSKYQIKIDIRGGEVETLVCRAEPYHFGQPIIGRREYDSDHDQVVELELPIVFNPQLDSVVYGNLNPTKTDDNLAPLFLDIDSVRMPQSKKTFGLAADQNPDNWTLSKLVHYLCWAGNPDETYVSNPELKTLQAVFDDGKDQIRHLHIPHGLYLPQALDRILNPLGYAWYLDLVKKGERTLKFFRRGDGTTTDVLKLPERRTDFDRQSCNLESLDIDYSISEIANSIVGLGSYQEYEITVELQRAWDKSKNNLSSQSKLRSTLPRATFEPNEDVWRKWVLGDIDDYGDINADFDRYDLTDLRDENSEPVRAVQRRRRFHPCLTMNADGSPKGKEHHGVILEFLDFDGTWKVVKGNGSEFRLLHTECGIYFSGEMPPDFLRHRGDNARLRITATIAVDTRMRYNLARAANSVNAETVTTVLDLGHRFHFKKVHESSQFYEDVTTGKLKALEVDDYQAMQDYCDQIQDAYNVAMISGTAVINGIDNWQYELGTSIVGISGRNISLAGRGGDESSKDQVFPQIVAITYDILRQHTVLTLQQFVAHRFAAILSEFAR